MQPILFEKEMRGIPLWLLREYLEELGGKAQSDLLVVGTGWSAQLSQLDDFQIGSLRVGQVRLVVTATPPAWQSLQPRLERKLLRAGG